MTRSLESKERRRDIGKKKSSPSKQKNKTNHKKRRRRGAAKQEEDNHKNQSPPKKSKPSSKSSPDTSIATTLSSSTVAASPSSKLQPSSLFVAEKKANKEDTKIQFSSFHEMLQRHDTGLLKHELQLRSALTETLEFRAEIAAWLEQNRSSNSPNEEDDRLEHREVTAVISTAAASRPVDGPYCMPIPSKKERRASKARRFLASLTSARKTNQKPTPKEITPVAPLRPSGDSVGDTLGNLAHTGNPRASVVTNVAGNHEDDASDASSRTMDDPAVRKVQQAEQQCAATKKEGYISGVDNRKTDSSKNSIPTIKGPDDLETAGLSVRKPAPQQTAKPKPKKHESLLPGWISNKSSKRFMEEMDEAARLVPSQRRKRSNHWHTTRPERIVPKGTNGDDEPGYAYQETVRCKEARAGLPCQDCYQCQRFYKVLQATGHDIAVEDVGRHRNRFAPPETPEDFWELDFIDELKEKRRQGKGN